MKLDNKKLCFICILCLTTATAYIRYLLRISFPSLRNSTATAVQFAEIELRGLIVDLPFEETESHEGTGSGYFNMESGFTGYCRDPTAKFYDEVRPAYPGYITSTEDCADWCFKFVEFPIPENGGLVGFSYSSKTDLCWCAFEGGKIPENLANDPPVAHTMTPGGSYGAPVYHPSIFAEVESSFTFEVIQEFKCYRRDVTKVAIYMQPALNGGTYPGACHTESFNLVSIMKNFIKSDGDFSSFSVDQSITTFNDEALESKLAAMSFFLMVDIERKLYGWNERSQNIIKNYVQNGGTLVMTGTYGNKDTSFLNAAFGWSLTDVWCSSVYRNAENTAGTPWESYKNQLGCPSATQHINCNGTPCLPMFGTESKAALVVLPFGTGRVIYLGFDFYNTGYRVDGYHVDCTKRFDPWITVGLRGSLLYAKSVSSAPESESTIE